MKDKYTDGFRYALKLRDPEYKISSNDSDGLTTWTLTKSGELMARASECCISNCDALGMIMRYLKNPSSFPIKTSKQIKAIKNKDVIKRYSVFNSETKCINTWEKRQNVWQWLPIISGDE